MRCHDGEEDTTQSTSGGGDAICKTTPFQEPCWEAVYSCVEYAVKAKRATNTLCQDKLVVLATQTGHHQAKDVKEGSRDDEIFWTVIVKEKSDDRTGEKHDKYL